VAKDLTKFAEAIEKATPKDKYFGEGKYFDFSGIHFPAIQDLASFLPNVTIGGTPSRIEVTVEEESIFSGATFEGEVYFSQVTFEESVDFSEVTFKESVDFHRATFEREVYFSQVTFEESVDFSEATFKESAAFSKAQFSGNDTSFSEAQFRGEETSFSGAEFASGQTSFQKATFKGTVGFSEATFKEKVTFWGTKENRVFDTQAWVWFHASRIEKPELLTFNTVLLHPSWFINADVRKVDFTDVNWYGMPGGPECTLDGEIGSLTRRDIESPYALLSQACQRLSANAEENREYPLANEFLYWSMDALRKEDWRSFGPIRNLYWLLSGYGVRARRAFFVLLGIWAAFTLLYILVPSSPFSGFSFSAFGEAIVYSLGALARLNPEPKPDPSWFQFLVTVEGLVGPLQIGLLLLAIRRQVIR